MNKFFLILVASLVLATNYSIANKYALVSMLYEYKFDAGNPYPVFYFEKKEEKGKEKYDYLSLWRDENPTSPFTALEGNFKEQEIPNLIQGILRRELGFNQPGVPKFNQNNILKNQDGKYFTISFDNNKNKVQATAYFYNMKNDEFAKYRVYLKLEKNINIVPLKVDQIKKLNDSEIVGIFKQFNIVQFDKLNDLDLREKRNAARLENKGKQLKMEEDFAKKVDDANKKVIEAIKPILIEEGKKDLNLKPKKIVNIPEVIGPKVEHQIEEKGDRIKKGPKVNILEEQIAKCLA